MLALSTMVLAATAQTTITATYAAAGGFVDAYAPAVTLDFWLRNDTSFGEKWQNASVLTIDFDDPNIVAAASALSGTLRVGGSPVNSIYFDTTGSCQPGGDGPSSPYYCSQVKPYIYACLTPQRWAEILRFAKKTGLKLLMGMNVCYGRKSANSSMDFSNMQTFLETTQAMGEDMLSPLIGFELGNEVVADGHIHPVQYSKDAAVARAMIDDIFGAGRMKFAGPADDETGSKEVLEAVSDNVFDYITYHQYPCCLPSAAFAADPTCMQQVDDAATAVVSDGITNNKPMAIWAGETSNCAGGGRVGYSDSFSDIFYYMYQLCVLPLLGVPLAARQAFVGGDYELLSRFNSTAHPSFWVAYLYGQHLAGAATYQVSQSVSSVTTGLRVFGFVDAENAKIAVVLNANVSTTYQLQLPDFASAVLVQKLSADSLSSGQILLNGKPLMLIPTAGATELPATPWVNATNPLTVPPLTAFFVKSL